MTTHQPISHKEIAATATAAKDSKTIVRGKFRDLFRRSSTTGSFINKNAKNNDEVAKYYMNLYNHRIILILI